MKTPSPGIPLKKLAHQFGMSLSGIRNAISQDRFPVQTFRNGGRRYADRQVVSDFFAAKRNAGLAALADETATATETAPDWRLVFKVEGQSQEENNAMLQGAADEMKAKGATHGRATIIPEAGTLFVEGWRVRPARETPLPTARECAVLQ